MSETKLVVRDIMTENVVTVREDTPIKDVSHLMLRDRINGIPVINENNILTGVITTTDLFKMLGELILDRTFGNYEHLFESKVIVAKDIMTKDVIKINPESSVEEIIKLSVYRNIHTFPVVEGNEIIGVLGKKDILNIGFSFVS